MLGVVIAVLLLQMIANAFTIMRAPDTLKTFVNGCLLVAILIADQLHEKNKLKVKA